MQICASPLLSSEPRFKSQGASELLWDFWKCKSQSIFAKSSCEISRVLDMDIEGGSSYEACTHDYSEESFKASLFGKQCKDIAA